jgi:hypothetical protein
VWPNSARDGTNVSVIIFVEVSLELVAATAEIAYAEAECPLPLAIRHGDAVRKKRRISGLKTNKTSF